MPARIIKNKDGSYKVVTPNGVHARSTSLPKAQAQVRLLNAVDHGWTPSKSAKTKRGVIGGSR